jgi:hypothetical protein
MSKYESDEGLISSKTLNKTILFYFIIIYLIIYTIFICFMFIFFV